MPWSWLASAAVSLCCLAWLLVRGDPLARPGPRQQAVFWRHRKQADAHLAEVRPRPGTVTGLHCDAAVLGQTTYRSGKFASFRPVDKQTELRALLYPARFLRSSAFAQHEVCGLDSCFLTIVGDRLKSSGEALAFPLRFSKMNAGGEATFSPAFALIKWKELGAASPELLALH